MNALEIRDLTKHYGDFCLDRLSLTLPEGCILGLIGENGAGKTTTMKLLLQMIRSDGGSVRILGKDYREDAMQIREEVGVVLDEVGMPDCLTPRQIGKVMRLSYRSWDEAAYTDLIRRLSLPWDKPFKDFSRGMKMKLGIALAMSHDSRLLLLDEATSGLDPVVRDEVVDMFRDYTSDGQRSILISSHIVSDLEKLCDYIAFLHKGKLLLCEEKDRLQEEYCMVHCEPGRLAEIPGEALIHHRQSPYGAEALALRSGVPADMMVSPVSIEDLFIFMAKEAN